MSCVTCVPSEPLFAFLPAYSVRCAASCSGCYCYHLLVWPACNSNLTFAFLLLRKGRFDLHWRPCRSPYHCQKQLEDKSGDVDVLGAIADAYADLGDLERAGMVWCFLALL